MQEKQGLVDLGMQREQESCHLEWPDHTPLPYIPRTTPTIFWPAPLLRDIVEIRCAEVHGNQSPEMQAGYQH